MVTAEVTMPQPKPVVKSKFMIESEPDTHDVTQRRKKFKLTKVFASWVVNLDVYPGEDKDSLIARAMQEVASKRLIPLPLERDHILEEI
jgi:hypothetical protein